MVYSTFTFATGLRNEGGERAAGRARSARPGGAVWALPGVSAGRGVASETTP